MCWNCLQIRPQPKTLSNMPNWIKTSEQLPPNGELVLTKIEDQNGTRNTQFLRRKNNLWFVKDGSMYVYYTPTHWTR